MVQQELEQQRSLPQYKADPAGVDRVATVGLQEALRPENHDHDVAPDEIRKVQSGLEVDGMQIRLSRDLEGRVRVAPGPITVEEFIARFPEVPRDLCDEPVLAEFVRAFGSQLRVAQKPSPCVAQAGSGDAEHYFYTRLVNDLAIYGIGLARRERTLQRLEALLVEYRKHPATFACTLVPRKGPDAPRAACR